MPANQVNKQASGTKASMRAADRNKLFRLGDRLALRKGVEPTVQALHEGIRAITGLAHASVWLVKPDGKLREVGGASSGVLSPAVIREAAVSADGIVVSGRAPLGLWGPAVPLRVSGHAVQEVPPS